MDFGSGFPSGSQARIRASLGIDGLLNGKFDKSGGDFTAYVRLAPCSGSIVQAGFTGTQFEVQSDAANGDAFIGFHRRSNYATRFGLNSDSEFGFGGFSESRFWKLWTEKNFDPNAKADLDDPQFKNAITVGSDYPVMYLRDNKVTDPSARAIGRFGFYNGFFECLVYNKSYGFISQPFVIGADDVARFSQRPTFGIHTPWDTGNLTPLKKYVGTITGDGTKTSFDVAHNLNTVDFTFNVKDASGYSSLVDVIPKDANTATIIMGAALDASTTRKVVIIG